jgi:hypothetical protein
MASVKSLISSESVCDFHQHTSGILVARVRCIKKIVALQVTVTVLPPKQAYMKRSSYTHTSPP